MRMVLPEMPTQFLQPPRLVWRTQEQVRLMTLRQQPAHQIRAHKPTRTRYQNPFTHLFTLSNPPLQSRPMRMLRPTWEMRSRQHTLRPCNQLAILHIPLATLR